MVTTWIFVWGLNGKKCWLIEQRSNKIFTTYYASLNPCVSFANSGCAPVTLNYVKMMKVKMIKSFDEHPSLISSHHSHHCMRTDGTWWLMVNWVFHYPQLPEHFINKSGTIFFREKTIILFLNNTKYIRIQENSFKWVWELLTNVKTVRNSKAAITRRSILGSVGLMK